MDSKATTPGNVDLHVYDSDWHLLDKSDSLRDQERVDVDVAANALYYVGLFGASPNVDLRLQNLVTTNSPLTAHGTAADDYFEFIVGNGVRFQINGVPYDYAADEISVMAFRGGLGEDSVTLTLPPNPTQVRGTNHSVYSYDVEEIVDLAGVEIVNSDNRFDVNRDGFVSPVDVLAIINQLNMFTSAQLLLGGASYCPDVDVDGLVTPFDALTLINRLNSIAAIALGGPATPEDEAAAANTLPPREAWRASETQGEDEQTVTIPAAVPGTALAEFDLKRDHVPGSEEKALYDILDELGKARFAELVDEVLLYTN